MCTDGATPSRVAHCDSLGLAVTGFGSGPNKLAVRTGLCPTLLAIGNATCSDLGSPSALSRILEPAARASHCCKLQWSGIWNTPTELAAVLIHLVEHQRHGADARTHRFVSTNSGNGWVSCIFAAYLSRYHGVLLHGLAVNGGKSEWTMSGDTRHLYLALGLAFRGAPAFDAEADAALMAHDADDAKPRSSIMPTSYMPARALLPTSWVGAPPPFHTCVRIGNTFDLAGIETFFSQLAAWCRDLVVWTGSPIEAQRANVSAAWSRYAPWESRAHRVGNFTVLSSPVLPHANSKDFRFVPKSAADWRKECAERVAMRMATVAQCTELNQTSGVQ